ncbi:hypothetical protein AMTRI_Chr02g217860 [Amborella trichopoda]
MAALSLTISSSLVGCQKSFTTRSGGKASNFNSSMNKHGPICSMEISHESKKEFYSNFSDRQLPLALSSVNNQMVDLKATSFRDLKRKLKKVISGISDEVKIMALIDHIQRLGIAYHFEMEIETALGGIYRGFSAHGSNDNLLVASLKFRLLRQHGYNVSSNVFNKFKDGNGNFKPSLSEDVIGMLNLYEASHLRIEGEDIMDEALGFCVEHLSTSMHRVEPNIAKIVRHALKLPLHFRTPRLETRHYIEVYKEDPQRNQDLLEFAQRDFNMVQSLYKGELKEVSRWWRELDMAKELAFARDQIHHWFMWPVAIVPEPQYSECRVDMTKAISFIYLIDDIYDVYGSMDELELFTQAITRWDLSEIHGLPKYMKVCYLALHDVTRDIARKIHKKHGFDITDYLRQAWTSLCEAYLVEAKWFRSGQVPRAKEYLKNAVTSTGVHVALIHMYFLMGHKVTRETAQLISNGPQFIRCPATILRLWDDLSTSMEERERGDDASYIESYMKEHEDESEESAREHTTNLIITMWKRLIHESLKQNPFPHSFTISVLNISRMAQVVYQTQEDSTVKDHIKSLLLDPISLSLQSCKPK